MSDDIEKTLEDIEALFAQTAHELTTDGDRVTFHKLSPSTLYFSDRPQRVVGHLTTGSSSTSGTRARTASPRTPRTRSSRSWRPVTRPRRTRSSF